MYNLPYYKEKDAAVVMDFIKQNPFGMLIGVDADQKTGCHTDPCFYLLKKKGTATCAAIS
jgi:predicted FMN-binding regulatory protein PaiB